MTTPEAITALKEKFGDAIGGIYEFRGDYKVTVAHERIVDICTFLRDQGSFEMLTDLSGVDNYGEQPRFEVHYLVYSFTHRCRLALKTSVPDDSLEIDSVVSVWQTADWHEREAYDMFGIRFRGHPNLKRILMWEGYPYFPLRKDFPLAGLPAELPTSAVGAGKVETAPMLGGPFVATIGTNKSIRREPRQHDTMAQRKDKAASPNKAEEV